MLTTLGKSVAAIPTIETISQVDLDAMIAYHEALNGEPGSDPKSPVVVSAFMDVYSDPSGTEFAEDYASWRAACPSPAASSPAASSAKVNAVSAMYPPDTFDVDNPDAFVSRHETAVRDIVGLVLKKYEDEATRSFAIGKRFHKHATWQMTNFQGEYTNTDFNNLASRIRDLVRVHVAIKPESIRVADWARCHVLRELIRTDAGDDVADSLSMYEYLAIVGKAMKFDVKALEGSLNPAWLDMVKGVASTRATGGRVTVDKFHEIVKATVESAKSARAKSIDPVKAEAAEASAKVKADKAAKVKAETAVMSAIDEGLKSGTVSADTALGILEEVAKVHGKTLAVSTSGFDPATASVADCEAMMAVLWNMGKMAEIRAIVAKGQKAIAAFDKMAAFKSAEIAAHEPVAAAA